MSTEKTAAFFTRSGLREHARKKELEKKAFWQGFEKRAGEDPGTSPWLAAEKAEVRRVKSEARKPLRIDPREASEWRGPEDGSRAWQP